MTLTALGSTENIDDGYAFRARIEQALREFLDRRGIEMMSCSPSLEPAVHALRDFLLAGGKRLRPAFCYWGWRGAGGHAGEPGIITAAAALELLHGCGLIHDDIIDASDLRRGQPSVHRRFADLHRRGRLHGSPENFGTAAAILLGDLCLTWCDQMFDESLLPAPAVRAAKSLFHLMHTEVLSGQYLDMLEQSLGTVSLPRSLTVIRYKTAKYTVERPLHVGGLLAGADEKLLAGYSRFALPIGEAFQLRDDVLGVFGDSTQTGKPAGDDLREGKHTVLIALAMERGSRAQRRDLDRLLGHQTLTHEGIDVLRSIIIDTGALDSVEEQIDSQMSVACQALYEAPLTDEVRAGLTNLAVASIQRSA
jgi:geranylgeranyl diphosphate synthase, type I